MNRRSFFAAIAGAPIAVAGVTAAKPVNVVSGLKITVDGFPFNPAMIDEIAAPISWDAHPVDLLARWLSDSGFQAEDIPLGPSRRFCDETVIWPSAARQS